jgi:transposase
MRYIGLDLALTTQHQAGVVDEQGHSLSRILLVKTSAQSLERLFDLAREGAAQEPLVVVREPTGMAWFPIAVFCQRQDVKVFLVNGQQVSDWRRYYQKHAKSDRIDARVLAKLPVVSPEKLPPLPLAAAAHLVCQRGCKELDRLSVLATAIQNRLRAIDRFAWPGLEQVLPELIAPFTRWFREQWYDPRRVVTAGAEELEHAWNATASKTADFLGDLAQFRALVHLAQDVLALYGADSTFLDYAALQAEVSREQGLLA